MQQPVWHVGNLDDPTLLDGLRSFHWPRQTTVITLLRRSENYFYSRLNTRLNTPPILSETMFGIWQRFLVVDVNSLRFVTIIIRVSSSSQRETLTKLICSLLAIWRCRGVWKISLPLHVRHPRGEQFRDRRIWKTRAWGFVIPTKKRKKKKEEACEMIKTGLSRRRRRRQGGQGTRFRARLYAKLFRPVVVPRCNGLWPKRKRTRAREQSSSADAGVRASERASANPRKQA